MAPFSDLDTTQISMFIYWNALDQGGASSIDPSTASSYANWSSVTTKDNGIEGTVDSTAIDSTYNRPDVQARIKTDGWMLVWLDQTEDIQDGTSDQTNAQGPWDVQRWQDWDDGPSGDDYLVLEDVLTDLQSALSTSLSYSNSELGHFNYEYPNATDHTMVDGSTTNNDLPYDLTRSSGTTLHWMTFQRSRTRSGNADAVVLDGTTVASQTSGYVTVDMIQDSVTPDEGETIQVESDKAAGSEDQAIYVCHTLWS